MKAFGARHGESSSPRKTGVVHHTSARSLVLRCGTSVVESESAPCALGQGSTTLRLESDTFDQSADVALYSVKQIEDTILAVRSPSRRNHG